MAMIEIRNVSKWYGDFQVLKNCSVSVEKGEVVVVCGPSGSGKSTLIKTVNALEPFQEGEILVNGVSVGDPKTDLAKLRSHVGMVFQHFELFPHLSIIDNLRLAQMKVLKRGRDEATERGLKLLERVGLLSQAEKFPGQLSGGQQQSGRPRDFRRSRRNSGKRSEGRIFQRPALGARPKVPVADFVALICGLHRPLTAFCKPERRTCGKKHQNNWNERNHHRR